MVNQIPTNIKKLLVQLRQANIKLWVQDGRLRARVPEGAMTSILQDQIQLHRDAMIELLQQVEDKAEKIVLSPIPKIGIQDNYALSNAQRRLWVLDQMEEEQIAYNMPTAIQLKGELDKQALEQSIQLLFQRHESLRTNFVEGQQVIHATIHFNLGLTDYTDPDKQTIQSHIRKHATFPFDLSNDTLLQLELLQLGKEEHILLFNMHHIISDGWSMGVLFKELTALYEACMAGIEQPLSVLAPLTIQYKDYAAWQNDLLTSKEILPVRDYWLKNLAPVDGLLPVLELPTDYPRPALKTYNGASVYTCISPDLLAKLNQLSQSKQATLFMSLTALVKVLLYRYSGQRDIIIGSPIAGRNHPDLNDQIGFYVNTLVLRNQIDPTDSFITFLEQVKTNSLAAFENDLYPFDKLVEELNLPRDTSRSAVFDVMLILQNNEDTPFTLGELDINYERRESTTSKFDLTFNFAERENSLHCNISYNTDLFKRDSIQRLMTHFETLLESVLANSNVLIDELNILPAVERQLLLEDFNNTKVDFPIDKNLIDLFEEQVEKTPNNIAVIFEETELTYLQLNEKANQIGHYLRTAYNIQPDDIIALQLERSEWMIIAMLGVLKTGAAYLPIASDTPIARTTFMLRDAQAKVLLTDESTYPTAFEQKDIVAIEVVEEIKSGRKDKIKSSTSSRDLAYIIYTSGSTGQPKGVQGSHRAIINRFYWMWTTYPFEEKEICCQKTTISFVDAVWEIFGPLLKGVPLLLIPRDILLDTQKLVKLLADFKVSRIILVPSLLQVLLNEFSNLENRLPHLGYWTTSGENLGLPLLSKFKESLPNAFLLNLYGSSEVAADVTYFDTRNTIDKVLIGKPIANTDLYILDKKLIIVPIGVVGELHVGGLSLARGYLNQPELTAEKFIPHPFKESERLYKTGDLARWLPDGNIEFLGRIDNQLKIRGYRIEAGEIETVLEESPQVEKAIVIAREDISGNKQLIAYLVLNQYETADYLALRSFLKQKLPNYMIPATFVPLDALPLTSSGKINHKALPAPDRDRQGIASAFVAPSNPIEIQLATIWKEVLFLDSEVSIHDDFFDLGGQSLLAIQLVSRIEKTFQIKIPLHQLFKIGTVAEIAKLLEPTEATEQPFQKEGHFTKVGSTPLDPEIYRQLIIYKSAWKGKRKSPQSLLTGLNTTGTRPALYWCLQGAQEFNQLAKYLGKEQPVYGMRSGHQVMKYSPENIENLAKHYANEIEEINDKGPYILGGNCQAGFIAYAIALELTRRGKSIQHMFILESLYHPSTGDVIPMFLSQPETSSMTFIFGEQSRFNPYLYHRAPVNSLSKYLPLGFDFQSLPCDHGQYFKEPNVQVLATIIESKITKFLHGSPLKIEKGVVKRSTVQPWSEEAYKVQLTLNTMPPKEVTVGDRLLLEVNIQNASTIPWMATSGLALGNQWYDDQGEIVQWPENRTLLKDVLKPMEMITLSFPINVPDKTGKYLLAIDLVEEGISRFKSKGNSVVEIDLNIIKKQQTGIINCVKDSVETANFYNRLGRIQEGQGNWQGMITTYLAAIEVAPSNIDFSLKLATAYDKMKDPLAAITTLEQAYPKAETHLPLVLQLADLYTKNNQQQKAIDLLQTCLHKELEEILIWLKIAQIENGRKNWDKAKNAFQLLSKKQHPHLVYVWNSLGRIYNQQDNNIAAKNAINKALEINPNNFHSHHILATIANKNKDWEQALVHSEKAIALAPNQFGAYPLKATILQQLKRYEEAEDIIQTFISLNADHKHAYAIAGNIAFKQKKYSQTEEMYLKAINLEHPNSAFFLSRLSAICAQENKLELAIQYLEQACELKPENINLLNQLNRLKDR